MLEIIIRINDGIVEALAPLGPVRITILDANIPHSNGVIPEDGDRLVQGTPVNVKRIEAEVNPDLIIQVLADLDRPIGVCDDCGEAYLIGDIKEGLCLECFEACKSAVEELGGDPWPL